MIFISPIIRLIAKIASIIFFILTALCCFGGYVSPEIFPLGSVAVLGMPVMVTISAIIIVFWLCTGKWIVATVGTVILIACSTPIKMWFPMNSPTEAEPGEPTITILTWNVLHGADLEMPDYEGSRVFETILKYKPDVVCLQEAFSLDSAGLKHYSQTGMDSIRALYPYELGDGTFDNRIISRFPLRHVYFGSLYSIQFAEAFTVKLPSREIAMINVHLPSFQLNEGEKGIFHVRRGNVDEKEKLGLSILEKLKTTFPHRAEAAEKVLDGSEDLAMPTIICGDFNDVPASWTYRLFLKKGFQDAYVATNFFPTYTFYPNYLYFHLDQIFYRGSLRPLSVERLDVRSSDHLPLLATFQILPGY